MDSNEVSGCCEIRIILSWWKQFAPGKFDQGVRNQSLGRWRAQEKRVVADLGNAGSIYFDIFINTASKAGQNLPVANFRWPLMPIAP